jgi:hypothetical protein
MIKNVERWSYVCADVIHTHKHAHPHVRLVSLTSELTIIQWL